MHKEGKQTKSTYVSAAAGHLIMGATKRTTVANNKRRERLVVLYYIIYNANGHRAEAKKGLPISPPTPFEPKILPLRH